MTFWMTGLVLLACGNDLATPAARAPSGASVPVKALTEPWSSQKIPVGTALIEVSTSKTLVLRQPTMSLEMIAPSYSMMRTFLVDSGWSIEEEDVYDKDTIREQHRGYFKRGDEEIRLTAERSRSGGVEIVLVR